ncbi:MAG TPA: DUF5009 domain-containing protein [Armatimonadota bacterium]|jgi:predicted acyltransferase
MVSTTAVPPPRRVQALDALRGIAILMMVLSGVVPATYPAWMHHAQCPPPTLKFNAGIPGITWVDLVFPFFVFSMGAAIPLALGRRMDKGEPWWKLGWGVIQRFLLLGLFAIYIEHIRPFGIGAPEVWQTWARALIAFAALLAILVRPPKGWSRPICVALRIAGWTVAAWLMYTVRRGDGTGFDPHNSDIIIMILANVVLGVSLVWGLSRANPLMRVGFMAVLMAVRLASGAPGFVQTIWAWSPEQFLYMHHLFFTQGPWLFHQGYTSMLMVAIPGTLIGDLFVTWMRAPQGPAGVTEWSRGRWWAIAGVSFALVPVLLGGLFTRHVVEVASVAAVICVAVRYLVARPALPAERLIHDVAAWGAFWLILGLLFEPYEGGIKKDPATMSYYFVSAGLACFTLIAFSIVMDVIGKPGALRLLADNGQNPMIAYAGLSNLVQPLLFIVGLKPLIDRGCETTNGMFLLGVMEVVMVALTVSGFTRAKIFLRT